MGQTWMRRSLILASTLLLVGCTHQPAPTKSIVPPRVIRIGDTTTVQIALAPPLNNQTLRHTLASSAGQPPTTDLRLVDANDSLKTF
ncbi:hypothetical protein [Leptothoe kymatousa]|uniref:Uncharacterized protein n=1 Tax=Leptothoe kymatousa TAU-MAC 1615 TaxID=2364775 RepID=A0ABS5Y1X8_9CYAN|nr:hypothetical protein [Leptothoe kymatousa]MBT9311840.1 hypothetical protein [Leptothoe kymatousa TAU-MAC 1615]